MARGKGKAVASTLPESVKELAARGLRYRFNGFWLTGSVRDRQIAEWIDSQPNAAGEIKRIIHGLHTGDLVLIPRVALGGVVNTAPAVQVYADEDNELPDDLRDNMLNW